MSVRALVETRIEGAGVVAEMLARNLPKRIHAAQAESMRQALSELERALRSDGARSRFEGRFTDTIQTRIEGQPSGERFVGKVGPTGENTWFTEYGRGPGGTPPLDRMRVWAGQKLGDESLGFIVARAIASRGTRVKRQAFPGKAIAPAGGWAHLRYTAKRRTFRVRKLFRDNIRRAVRLAR